MARDINAATITATQQPTIIPIAMVDLDFEGGAFRAHSGVGDVVYGGNTFTGLGHIGKITSLEEDIELAASGISVVLSGVDPSMVSIALNTHYQGRTGIVYITLLNESTMQIEGEPCILFQGRMDNMNIKMGATAEIELTIENILRDWDRPRVRRYNNVDQQSLYPDDKGLEFIDQAAEKSIYWGGADPG